MNGNPQNITHAINSLLGSGLGKNYIWRHYKLQGCEYLYAKIDLDKANQRNDMEHYQSPDHAKLIQLLEKAHVLAPIYSYSPLGLNYLEISYEYHGIPLESVASFVKDRKIPDSEEFLVGVGIKVFVDVVMMLYLGYGKEFKNITDKDSSVEGNLFFHGSLDEDHIVLDPYTLQVRLLVSSTLTARKDWKNVKIEHSRYIKLLGHQKISNESDLMLLEFRALLDIVTNFFTKINSDWKSKIQSAKYGSGVYSKIYETYNKAYGTPFSYNDIFKQMNTFNAIKCIEVNNQIKFETTQQDTIAEQVAKHVYIIKDKTLKSQPFIEKIIESEMIAKHENEFMAKIPKEAQYLSHSINPLNNKIWHKVPNLLLTEYSGTSLSELNYDFRSKEDRTVAICTWMHNLLEDLIKFKIFHCDIKSNNLCVDPYPDRSIRLIDFGHSIYYNNGVLDPYYGITGYTYNMAAREVLEYALLTYENAKTTNCKIIPFKADIYSLGKTMIKISDNLSFLGFEKTFYLNSFSKLNESNQRRYDENVRNLGEKESIYKSTLWYMQEIEDFYKAVQSRENAITNQITNELYTFLLTTIHINPDKRPSPEYSLEQLDKIKSKALQQSPVNKSHYFLRHLNYNNVQIPSIPLLMTDKDDPASSIIYIDYLNPTENPTTTDFYKVSISNLLHSSVKIYCMVGFIPVPCLYFLAGSIEATIFSKTLSDKLFLFDLNVPKLIREMAPMKKARCDFGFTTWWNHIAVCGGISSSEFLNSIEIYDAAYDHWSDEFIIDEGIALPSAVYSDEKLYIISGKRLNLNDPCSNNIYKIDIKSGSITKIIIENLAKPLIMNTVLPLEENTYLVLATGMLNKKKEVEALPTTMYKLKITNNKALITEADDIINDLQIYSNFQGCNTLRITNKYLIIPSMNHYLTNFSNKLYIEYDTSTKILQCII